MRPLLFLLGLACMLVGCGIFHKKPVTVIRNELQMSIVEEEVSWKRGDTLTLGVEIVNKTDSSFNIYSKFPAFRLVWSPNTDFFVESLFFISVEDKEQTSSHVLEPLAIDTLDVSFVTALEQPYASEMYWVLWYWITEEEPVPRKFSIVSEDSVKVRILD